MASYLGDLPDELILEIYKYLRPARSFGNDRYCKSRYGEGIDSNQSLATFASLCLTSKHLSQIAHPELYANVITANGSSKNALQRISEFTKAVVHNSCLGRHIVYINHYFDWSDDPKLIKSYTTGFSCPTHRKVLNLAASHIWVADLLSSWNRLLTIHPEQAQLVLLLALAPNVSHIVIDFLEQTLPTFFFLLGLDPTASTQQRPSIHRFKWLERVIYNSQGDSDYEYEDAISFDRCISILHSLQSLPALRHHQHNAAWFDTSSNSVTCPRLQLRGIETLEFSDCNINIVAAAVEGCNNLKRFNLRLDGAEDFYDFSELYPALRTNLKTLEYIDLFNSAYLIVEAHEKPIGSFADFLRLKRLYVTDVVMMGKPFDYDIDTNEHYIWTNFKPISPLIELVPVNIPKAKVKVFDTEPEVFAILLQFLAYLPVNL